MAKRAGKVKVVARAARTGVEQRHGVAVAVRGARPVGRTSTTIFTRTIGGAAISTTEIIHHRESDWEQDGESFCETISNGCIVDISIENSIFARRTDVRCGVGSWMVEELRHFVGRCVFVMLIGDVEELRWKMVDGLRSVMFGCPPPRRYSRGR